MTAQRKQTGGVVGQNYVGANRVPVAKLGNIPRTDERLLDDVGAKEDNTRVVEAGVKEDMEKNGGYSSLLAHNFVPHTKSPPILQPTTPREYQP